MTDSQKRYTVMQISKYRTEAEEFDKKAEKNRWYVYGCIGVMLIASQIQGIDNVSKIFDSILGIIKYSGLYFGLDNFRLMIENISKKTGLENMATNLEYQVENDDLSDREKNNFKGRGL